MTLTELKAEIMLRAREVQICDEFQNILNASNYAEILEAGKKFPKWVWVHGIMDTFLINEFPSIDLENAGIYTGSHILTGVEGVAYVIKGASVDFINGNNERLKIINLGGEVSIVASDNSYIKLETHLDSISSIQTDDNSVLCANFNDDSTPRITANNNSNLGIVVNENASLILDTNNDAYVNIKVKDNSQLNYTILDSSIIKITAQSTATVINDGTPL